MQGTDSIAEEDRFAGYWGTGSHGLCGRVASSGQAGWNQRIVAACLCD